MGFIDFDEMRAGYFLEDVVKYLYVLLLDIDSCRIMGIEPVEKKKYMLQFLNSYTKRTKELGYPDFNIL